MPIVRLHEVWVTLRPTGTIAQIVLSSPVTRTAARDLLAVLATTAAVTFVAITTMALIAAGAVGGPSIALLGLIVAGISVPGVVRRGRNRRRRRLRQQVGDPATVSGVWRQLLAAAWRARDQFADVVAQDDGSPLMERLADHQVHVDAALARCGTLARDGAALAEQLRGYRVRRLRHDLSAERARAPAGRRAQALAEQLAEADSLATHVRELHDGLEAQVQDLRSAAWRAAALRTDRAADGDPSIAELLIDLEHLRDALATVDDLERSATGPSSAEPRRGARHRAADDAGAARPATQTGRRYDV